MTNFMQKYVRGNGGKTIHRAECKVALKSETLPWTYADYATPHEIQLIINRIPGLKACVRCKPNKDA